MFSVLRKTVALIAGIGIVLGGALLPAIPAMADPIQLVVPVVKNGQPIAGVLVKACESGTLPPVCVQANSGDNGNATLSPTLSNPNATLTLSAGGPTTSYSSVTSSVTFTNAVPSNISPLSVQDTTWSDISVTAVDSGNSNAPIQYEPITLSTTSRSDMQTTSSSGMATFRVDNSLWGGTITATLGGGQSSYVSQSGTVTNGLLQLSTTQVSYNYTLSGVVTDNNGVLYANKTMKLQSYSNGSSSCVEFQTDGSGSYSVTNVSTRSPMVGVGACNVYSQSEFDSISGFTFNNSTTNQTFNIALTRTGVNLTVTEAGTNNPISGLPVKLTGQYGASYATTDQNGVAHFYGLTSGGTYRAAYVREQGNTSSLELYEEKTNTSTVTVGQQNSVGSDSLVLARLQSAPATPVTISGRVVTGANNTAVANARVSVSWSNNQLGLSYKYLNFNVYTDAQGNYSVSGLPFGRISVNVTANGFRQTYFAVDATDAQTTYSRGSLNLRPSPRGDLVYAGVLKDSNNNVIRGMRLTLTAAGSSGIVPEATTDSNGAFSFNNLSEGMYFLSADVWASDSIYQPFSHNTSFIDLTTSRPSVQITLNSRTSGNATASGHVAQYQDSAGVDSATPLAGKIVYIWPVTGGQGFQTETDTNGDWSIAGLPNNQQYMVSVQYDYGLYEYPIQQNSVVAKTTGGIPHQLLLKKISAGTGSLTGRVKNAANYSNIPNAQVTLYRTLGGVSVPPVVTDSRGEYSFINLPEGEYFLMIGDQFQNYKDAFMSVEIGAGSNRVNALLTGIDSFAGEISGTILDDRGVQLQNAYVEIWDPNDSTVGGSAMTNLDGQYSISGIPLDTEMNVRVTPTWDLRYEVASFNQKTTLDTLNPSRVIDVQLTSAAFITGTVSGIPTSGNVPTVFAELINASNESVISTTVVSASTGLYTFASVPAGNYVIRYTQRGNFTGYSGGSGGMGFGGTEGEVISLQPVYWDNSTNGTSDRSQATSISVVAGARISGKSVTVSRGSSIEGTISIETADGISKLTGTRAVLVYVYQKQSDGSWDLIGYPTAVNGYTNSEIQIAGLAEGSYKLKFEDSRKGNNSLETSFNGGASSLSSAAEIEVGNQSKTVVEQTMSVAPPERSAEAFDLDDLGQSQLGELENQITIDSELSPGSIESIYVGVEFAGEYVSAFANSTPTTLGSWKQVDSNGYISVVIPSGLEQGSHRVAVQDANLQVIGWSAVTVGAPATEAPIAKQTWKRNATATAGAVSTVNNSSSSTVKKPKVKKEEVNAESDVTTGSSPDSPNFWIFGGLAAVLAAGVAGGVWLIRSRRS